ncbi:galactose-specific lectin nattectin-like [Astyanax mexicanus]|uniref:Galactose-specific lectin nattectin-like n=1 Tax=Astyanax mexicanus TaxID=7994 RepID=A0A8T2LQW0_ASTMX|nr:galactose-specific lectin nattectin-like [Astyanax mexicanus]
MITLFVVVGRPLGNSLNAWKYCQLGWSTYERRCFRFFKTALQWIYAEAECLRYGGNLASVHSANEYAFLKKLIHQGAGSAVKTWIGGHDAVKEGRWFWSDGSKMNFQNWGKNEPNNNLLGEDCLEIIYGGTHLLQLQIAAFSFHQPVSTVKCV